MHWVEDDLQEWNKCSLLRTLRSIEDRKGCSIVIDGKEYVDFSSNDYLGLADHPYLREGAVRMAEWYGTSASASRLMSGDLVLHHELENRVARFKGKEAGLIFGSGYLANVGIIPALLGKGDVLFSDSLNHASIIDGCRLSGAHVICYEHCNIYDLSNVLERRRRNYDRALIISESIYSMDGDHAPLHELVYLKTQHDALLMVDEAHATGVCGRNGAGLVEAEGLVDEVDIIMGTFSKALASYGAYVVATQCMIDFLINKARSFVFSTALPPSVVGASLAALDLVEQEPIRRKRLMEHTHYFRELLKDKGIETKGSWQIVPVMVGGDHEAIVVSKVLEDAGIYAVPIRPPTVPHGESRLRFSVTAHHPWESLNEVAALLQSAIPGVLGPNRTTSLC